MNLCSEYLSYKFASIVKLEASHCSRKVTAVEKEINKYPTKKYQQKEEEANK
jgi:hypothetical protein